MSKLPPHYLLDNQGVTMPRNPYFTMGTAPEQDILEDIIIESINIYGLDMYYIPRSLVAKDDLLGEDRLSEFKNSYPVVTYFESIDGFESSSYIQSKFGLSIEQTATLVIARKEWRNLVGRYGQSILPNRPAEGDLIYFPLTNGLFEIKFVNHQDPFYQLGKLYVYKLSVELFQYASERFSTGVEEIDVFESLKTFDDASNTVEVSDSYGDNDNMITHGTAVTFNDLDPFSGF
jgi:hypothetical protein